ncbi:HD domain-containing protein [Candidatus Sumerlaeota bacterium]|nr:HD domain-containing protein [Candidatus Sumerlaeota bacterium]
MAEPASPISELSVLVELSRQIITEPASDPIYQSILEKAVALTDAEGGTIYFYDEPSGSLVFKFVISTNPDVAERLKNLRLKKGVGIVGRVAETLQSDLVADARTDPQFARGIDRMSGFETRSILTVPLHFFEGETQSPTLVGVLQLVNKRSGLFSQEDVHKMEAFGGFAAAHLTRENLLQRIRRQYLGTIASLAEAVDAKDPYTHGHTQRVSGYAVALGRQYGLLEGQLFDLHIASLLHDIGKIAIPDAILRKEAALTDEERKRIETHPREGVRILKPVSLSPEIYGGILYHHEKWDGTGYPEQLSSEQIPLFATFIAFADVFDALTTNRPYRKALGFDQAREIIMRDAGKQFDPDMARVFSTLRLEEAHTE